MSRRPILPRLKALLRQDKGLALVEFAFALPIMMLMYLGGYQISDAIACNRKVTITARAIADLTSQYSLVQPSDLDTILNASAQIMAPYPTSNALVRVSEIHVVSPTSATIVWSRALNGSARTAGNSFVVPSSIATTDTYLLYAEVNYAYSPIATYGMTGPVGLHDAIYMSPRISKSVDCNGC